MELSEIPIWQWVAAAWTSMWLIAIGRTWSRIVWLLDVKYPRHMMTKQPFLHFCVYAISINFPLLIIGFGLVLSDERRDLWVKAYVRALGSEKK